MAARPPLVDRWELATLCVLHGVVLQRAACCRSSPTAPEPIEPVCFASPPPQKLMLPGGPAARYCIPLRAVGEAPTTEAG